MFGPGTCEIGPKVLRKVYRKFTESSESSKTCPGGPIRAHMGPYGPQPGHRDNREASIKGGSHKGIERVPTKGLIRISGYFCLGIYRNI